MRKMFCWSAKLIVNDSETNKALASMHQSVMTKTKNSVSKDWITETIVEHSVKIFEC